MRERLERAVDHALTFALGGLLLYLFISIRLFGVVMGKEDNPIIRDLEIILGITIIAWSIYRFVKMIKYYRIRGYSRLSIIKEGY